MTANPNSERFEQLLRALEAARAAPTGAKLRDVAVALQTVQFSDDDDMTDADDELALRCEWLARELMRQLGPSAPPWLRRFVLGEEVAGDDGPPRNAILYECPICGAEVESAPGLRAKCSAGHAPALVVAAVSDDDE